MNEKTVTLDYEGYAEWHERHYKNSVQIFKPGDKLILEAVYGGYARIRNRDLRITAKIPEQFIRGTK